MEKADKKANKKVLISVLVCLMLFVAVLVAISIWEKQEYSFDYTTETTDTVISSDDYILNKNIETVLVMGLDKFSEDTSDTMTYKNDRQADFLMLFIIDNENKNCKALQINRDTMVEMDVLGVAGQKVGIITQQIALSHTYGNGQNVSCRNTTGAVSNLLGGIKIDHYVSVTMDAVPVFNDLVGGVTIQVLDDFTGIDDTLVKGETVTLMGDKALTYVRTRYGMEDSTNSNRMIRQKQYIDELYRVTREKLDEDEDFVLTVWENLAEYTVSDCYEQDLLEIYEKISGYEFLGTIELEGESVVGEKFMEFYPDREALNMLVRETFYIPRG